MLMSHVITRCQITIERTKCILLLNFYCIEYEQCLKNLSNNHNNSLCTTSDQINGKHKVQIHTSKLGFGEI